jgi:hypothetical protein
MELPDQMDVLKWFLSYRKQYGPITDNSVENLADHIAAEIRCWHMDRDQPTPEATGRDE